jgi:hypothetical protein
MTRSRQLRTAIAVLAVLPFSFVPAKAQDNCKQKDSAGTLQPHSCNGISVGAPKVFDNRTLTLMLEALSQTLHSQQQSFIDQKSVLGALSNLQGFSQTESSTNLSVTGSPTPATDVKTTLNTGNVDANGNPLPNTFQRQTDVSRASVTPQAPALDTFSAVPGFNPNFGSSASDLLNDQVNLTYQIFNLQMILERSLTDRLLPDVNWVNRTRLQAVLGFNVTIDPPRTANDAVAVVEITLISDKEPLSLVSLMPQEKTYNSAALSNKSNAFGGAAAVSAFQIGFSARKRSQIFYLYRDTDTLSYERMTSDPKKIVFGWMFRPVLGRRSISPGLRQLFAIMALPNVDCINPGSGEDDDPDKPASGSHPCIAKLKSEVRTYWKKYDRATLTSFERGDANRASHFWYGLSMGLSKPQIFGDRKYENGASYPDLDVQSSANYQDALKPNVTHVAWRPTGANNIVISARGWNFFSQTKVALGDKTYSEGGGLILKSNQAFDLVTTLDALVNGPGTILGRYDIGVPLTTVAPPSLKNTDGVEVQNAFLSPALAGIRKIEIHLLKKASEQQAMEIKPLEDAKNSAYHKLGVAAASASKPNIAALTTEVSTTHAEYERKYHEIHSLDLQSLPLEHVTKTLDLPETPVISVNGTPLELPYEISNTTEGGIQHVVIQANVKDSVVSDSGGGIVKVSWPFYRQDKWTAAYRFYNPDLAFEVTRVSQKSILVHRIDGPSFKNAPENTESVCWRLIAGDEELPLIGCPVTSTPTPKECEKKKDPCAPPPPLPVAGSDYVAAATVDSLPDKVVLVAPNSAIYNLTVPALKAKDDKVAPIELKQYDSQWIEIKASELTTGAAATSTSATATSTAAKKDTPPDLNKVTSVEANGKPVNYVKPADKTASTDATAAATDKTKKTPPPLKTIKVEITRELTSKPGTIDIAFHAAGNQLLGTRQLHVTQTDWSNKGDK